MKRIRRLWLLIMAMMLFVAAMPGTWAQNSNQQPAGGGTTSEAAGPKKSTTPKPKTATPKSARSGTKSSPAAVRPASGIAEKIDGKWWTSGNDFGKSAVVFTQAGNDVSGRPQGRQPGQE